MSLLKQLNDAGIMCWFESKKNSNCFATASAQRESEDPNTQNTPSQLQIFTFDVADRNQEPTLLGKIFTQHNATSITWTTFGEDTSVHPFGLIIIGTDDGSAVIYDAQLIISAYKKGEHERVYDIGKVALIKEYETPINAIEYNSLKPNLIAMGAEDVLVMDISKDVANPDVISPGEPNYHEGSIITSVSWNKKVPHILASASNNGVAVVWNLKTSQVSFQINETNSYSASNQQQQRHLSLAWNPEIPLQFAITYDDEKKPELQIWDLRHPQGPVILLEEGHTKGIQTLTWCTSDPSLIITVGLDNKVVCWNVKNKQIVSQSVLNYEIVNAQWSKIPSLYSVVSSSGQVQIFTLNSDNITAYPPKWYQPPVGAVFAPNGTLLHFSENTQQEIRQKQLRKAQTLPDHQAALQDLEIVIDDTNPSQLCEWKAQRISPEDTFELDQWKLLKGVALNTNKDILEALGFKRAEIIRKAETYTGKKHNDNTQNQQQQNTNNQEKQNKVQQRQIKHEFTTVDDAESFFDNLNVQQVQNNTSQVQQQAPNSSKQKKSLQEKEEEVLQTEVVSKNINWDAGIEKIIKENMIVGNYEGAIDCALKCGRVAEGLLIAFSKGEQAFKSTMDEYFTSQTDPFIKQVFRNLIKDDINGLSQHYDLKSWRECAGLAITSSKNLSEFQQIMNKLGERFIEEKKDFQSAVCCFILAQNFTQLVQIYSQLISQQKKHSQILMQLSCAQKLILLSKIISQKNRVNDGKFDSLLLYLSKFSLQKNQSTLAFKILDQASPNNYQVAKLKDFLYNIYPETLQNNFQKPVVPYSVLNINIVYKVQKVQNNVNESPIRQHVTNNNPNVNNNNNNNVNPLFNKGGRNQQEKQEIKSNRPIFNPNDNQAKNNLISPPINNPPINNINNNPPPQSFNSQPTQPFNNPDISKTNAFKAPPQPAPIRQQPNPINPPKPPEPVLKQPQNIISNNNQNTIQNFVPNPPPVATGANKIGTFVPPPPVAGGGNNQKPPGPGPVSNVTNFRQNNQQAPAPVNKNVLNAPPPVFSQEIQSQTPLKSDTVQKNDKYIATQEQKMLIQGCLQSNMLIFDQIDPKRKDEHAANINHVLTLLNNSELKQKQVELLYDICKDVTQGQQNNALNCHQQLCKIDFSTHKHWINTIKRIIVRK